MRVVLPAIARPLVEARLPDTLDVGWWANKADALALAPAADVGWFDMYDAADMVEVIGRAERLRWLSTLYAGVDWMPLSLLRERGVTLTNGAGVGATAIAEWVVMGMLTVAKRYDEVVRARDRGEWLRSPPGRGELADTRALILGGGAIGGRIAARLAAFEVNVTTVRRTPKAGELGPDDWRARLGEFDWVILAVPATPETDGMIGQAELAAMKPSAVLINIARGSVVDQPALVEALRDKSIAAAFLDVTTPEPLPPDDPLWALPNAHITMHLSGQATTRLFERAASLFLRNLAAYRAGAPMENVVDLNAGY